MASKSNTGRSKSGSKTKSSKAVKNSSRAGTRKTGAKQVEEEAALSPEKLREIYLFGYLAVSIFLFCSNIGICGVVGRAISGFFFGLFGTVTYIMPIYIFLSAAFLLSNGPKKRVVKKVIWVGAALLIIGFICQIAAGAADMDAAKLYEIGSKDKRGGGVLFGGLLVLLYKMIGKAGTIIFTALIGIVVIIVVAEISIIDLFKKIFTFDFGQRDEDDDNIWEEPDEKDRRKTSNQAAYRDILSSIEVLEEPEQETSAQSRKTKGRKKQKKNVVVAEEEIHELKPEKEDATALWQEPEMPAAVPVNTADQASDASIDALVEAAKQDIAAQSVPILNPLSKRKYNRQEENGDFFDLKPSKETYIDELTGDIPEDDNEFRYVNNNDSFNYETVQPDDYTDKEEYESEISNSSKAIYSDKTKSAASGEQSAGTSGEALRVKSVGKADKEAATKNVLEEINAGGSKPAPKKEYKFPPMSLLVSGRGKGEKKNDSHVRETAMKLKSTLESFGVNVTITNYSCGPAVTRYEMQPEQGVKVSKILSLSDDIKLNLAAADIRIEAPIPGKAAIGIEVPNKENQTVFFRDLIDNDNFKKFPSNIAFAVGKDISGQVIVTDIAKMPHLLIAGSTGSGKSVCINTLIMSILYKAKPDDVKMIMVDPKMVELTAYNGIPHLLIPVVTDPKKASGALNWAVMEMTKRYQLFAQYNVRNIQGFNKKVEEVQNMEDVDSEELKKMPQIVVIVDELADLMMVAHGEVEDSIVRLSQLARAAGIHLVIATQRPSVDVITGLIKANVPSRIAFAVSSGVDSRTIIDMNGAEKLLGKGDMLFYPTGYTKPVRVQGAFVSDDEVVSVVNYIKKQYGESEYDEEISQSIDSSAGSGAGSGDASGSDSSYDEYFEEAARLVIEKDKASIGNLQRVFRIGFNRAARIMDQLCEAGVVGPEEGTKPRRILMTMDQFDEYMSV